MNAIEVRNVSKSFKVYYDKGATLKEKILFKKRNRYEEHHVLKDINLTIRKGEVVGLVGKNGCGKSTLLKLMTRIIYPDQGSITVNGKVSSLLELGAGFHPDMSGRENIYTNASIFGLTKKEIDERLDEIIAFSELGEFIDNPVRTYSSGMYMRLAFSVAINVDAEVLLVDEILAVGDAAFQAKCFNKMQDIKRSGATIVIVSHDLASIERLCDKAVWIDNGYKRAEDRPHDVVAMYLGKVMTKDSQEEITEVSTIEQDDNRTGDRSIEILDIEMRDCITGRECTTFKTGDSLEIVVSYRKQKQELKDAVVGIGIFRSDGLQCYGTNSYIDSMSKLPLNNEGRVCIQLRDIPLLEGEYVLDIAFHDEYGKPYDYIRRAKAFSVYSIIKDVGVFRIEHQYTLG